MALFRKTCRAVVGQTRRIAVFVVGMAVVLVGVVLLPLPGPGSLVIALGLGVLSVEFLWARKGLGRLREVALQVRDRVRAALSN